MRAGANMLFESGASYKNRQHSNPAKRIPIRLDGTVAYFSTSAVTSLLWPRRGHEASFTVSDVNLINIKPGNFGM